MSVWNHYNLLDFCTSSGQNLGYYHDLVLIIIGMVLVGVGLFLTLFIFHKLFFKGMLNRTTKSSETLEVIWTVVPAVFLTILGFESLVNLYLLESSEVTGKSVEAHGHQWYWDYNYNTKVDLNSVDNSSYNSEWSKSCEFLFEADMASIDNLSLVLSDQWVLWNMKGEWVVSMESYGVAEESLNNPMGISNSFRKMDVTSCCLLAQGLTNEVKVSTSDVMHSWGVPSLGVKADAIPGRVNSVVVNPLYSGFFFGNCYELCGPGHSSMPIIACVVSESTVESLLKGVVSETCDWSEMQASMSSLVNEVETAGSVN